MESVTPILEFNKTCVSYTKQTGLHYDKNEKKRSTASHPQVPSLGIEPKSKV